VIGNPVQGRIYPKGTAVSPGQFVVTAGFGDIDASHPTPHQGIDIGDGKCGSPILAVEDGVVTAAFMDPAGPLIVRYRLTKYPAYEAALAHMPSLEVAVGQAVKRGQVIGHIGASGATACHLHGGMKLNGVEIDWWPLLAQNQEDGMDASFSPKGNRTVTVNAGARHRLAPDASDPTNIAIGSDPGGPLGGALHLPLMGTVVGVPPSSDPGNSIWYAYWRPETKKVYYIHTSACGPETPWEATTGHSDQELIDTARKAGHNAAVDVAAVGKTALDTVAAKYPL
jgi:murein DD-endopeptidase MepM/ murein hydrolase activator NlpD